MSDHIFIGGGGDAYGAPQVLLLDKANRHGLVAGATGTGKTVTLQIMAEGFSAAGVPVFLSDVKGDLSGLAAAGSPDFKLHDAFMGRAETIGLDLQYDSFPVTFWDLFGQQGHPIRATVAEMGPLLLSRLMELTDVQEGVLNVAFRAADEEGLPLLDLKDLQALLVWVGQNAKDLSLRYGNVAGSSIGAIQRRPVVIDEAIAIRTMAYFALTFDHRLVDGADADRFMAHIKTTLQEFDEAAHAADVARHLGTDHTDLVLTARQARDVVPMLPEMAAAGVKAIKIEGRQRSAVDAAGVDVEAVGLGGVDTRVIGDIEAACAAELATSRRRAAFRQSLGSVYPLQAARSSRVD